MTLQVHTLDQYGGVSYYCTPFDNVTIAPGESLISDIIPVVQTHYSAHIFSFSGTGLLTLTVLIENADPTADGLTPSGFTNIFTAKDSEGVFQFSMPPGVYRRLKLTNSGASSVTASIVLSADGRDRGEKGDAGDDGASPSLRSYQGYLQWNDAGVWRTLVKWSDVAGTDTDPVEFRMSGSMIQWKLPTDSAWQDLYDTSDYALQSALTAHTSNTSNPHVVTKAQVGLGNCDNTADADKPVSTAAQTALALKANFSDVATALALKADVTDLALKVSFASLAASTGSSLSGHTQGTANAGSTTVQAKLREWPSVKSDFGAVGNGTTDDRAAFVKADTDASGFIVPFGAYKIASNLTIAVPVEFAVGASLVIPTGVTVVFLSTVTAPERRKIFQCSGTGKVVLNESSNKIGYPEWWGAVASDAGTDSAAAINACIVACPVTDLAAATYYCGSTVLMQTAKRVLRGAQKAWTTSGGTKIINTTSTGTICLIGLNSNPGSINSHLIGTYVKDITFGRSATITASSECKGVLTQWTLWSYLENVESMESQYAFYFSGTVQAHAYECAGFRSTSADTTTGDKFYGFYLNGGSGLAAAGGNASVYLHRNNVSCAASGIATTVGFSLDGACADSFLYNNEITSCNQAIVLVGGSSTGNNGDIHLVGNIGDGLGTHGILIQGTEGYTSIVVSDNYMAPAGTATSFIGELIYNCTGAIVSSKNQLICWPASGSTGLRIASSSGIISRDDLVTGAAKPVEIVSSSACRVETIINQPEYKGANAAIVISGSSNRCYIAPTIKGGSNVLTAGVNFSDNTNTYCEVNCTLIHAGAISGGYVNKLLHNGTQITSTGAFGTGSIATGIMA